MLAALLVASTGLAPRARAEGAPTAEGGQNQAATLAERARLQGQLDRVNAEIDALKRHPRGIRDDYRLRGRMADAEALARRLTELDARLGPRPPAPPDMAPQEIRVSPSDDRAEREAKADILSDQARRLSAEASLIEGRLTTLRARNELKRRSGQLERDPFAPLEQAKSRVGINGGGPSVDVPKSGTPGRSSTSMPSLGTSDGSVSGGSTNGAAPQTGGGAAPGALPPSTPTTTTTTTPPPPDSASSLAGQLRGVLDPTSLEEVRRLETPGAGATNIQVMERALATLRSRAAQLTATSAALRAPRAAP